MGTLGVCLKEYFLLIFISYIKLKINLIIYNIKIDLN